MQDAKWPPKFLMSLAGFYVNLDADVQQMSLGSDDVISRQQIDALDTLINKSDTSSRLTPYLYANI